VMEFTHDHAEACRPDPMDEAAEIVARLQEAEDEKDKV
jgi:hypothetical protein